MNPWALRKKLSSGTLTQHQRVPGKQEESCLEHAPFVATAIRKPSTKNWLTERGALAEKFHITQENLVEEYKLAAFAQVADPVTWPEKHKALDSLARILGFDKPDPHGADAPSIQITTITDVLPPGMEPEEPTVVEGEGKTIQ